MGQKRNKKAFIIEEIEKKGYPLEKNVIAILREKGWDTYPSVHFYDKDSGKDRELDIRAEKEIHLEALDQLLVNIRLLIQCKKIPGNAWVFFEGPMANQTIFAGFPKIITVLDAFEHVSHECLRYIVSPVLELHYHQGFLSSSYCEIILDSKISNKRDSNLWEAVVSLIKAIGAETQECLQHECISDLIDELKKGQVLDWASEGAPQCIYLVYPLVVFEGEMYSAKFPLNKKNLNKTNYIHLFTNYKSANYREELSIDVIEKQILCKYLNMIENDLDLFKKCLEENGETFINEQVKTLVDELKPGLLEKM